MPVTPVDLYLVRHGTDVTEFAEKFGEDRLTTEGQEQAKKIASFLEKQQITRIYSSPSQPAMETSEYISASTGINFQTDPKLAARELGQANGMSYKQVRKQFTTLLQKSQFDVDWKFPDGESNGDVYKRTRNFANFIIDTSSGKMERIVVVSQTLVLNYIIYVLQGIGF